MDQIITVTRSHDYMIGDDEEPFVIFRGKDAEKNAKAYADMANSIDNDFTYDVEPLDDDVPVYTGPTPVWVNRHIQTEYSLEQDLHITTNRTDRVIPGPDMGKIHQTICQVAGPQRDPYDAAKGRHRHFQLNTFISAPWGSDIFAEADKVHHQTIDLIRNCSPARRFWLGRKPYEPIYLDVLHQLASGMTITEVAPDDDKRVADQARADWKEANFVNHYGSGPDALKNVDSMRLVPLDPESAAQLATEVATKWPELAAFLAAQRAAAAADAANTKG